VTERYDQTRLPDWSAAYVFAVSWSRACSSLGIRVNLNDILIPHLKKGIPPYPTSALP